MTIEKAQQGNALTLTVSGRLDTTTAPQLSEELQTLPADVEKLTLDFEKLEYISSAGLRVLLQAQKAMAVKGGMVIKHINETVSEVFEVTGFMDILTIEK